MLDLFAGSGALGFESLSRGAAHVTFVEKHGPTAHALGAAAKQLGVGDRVQVIAAPAERAAGAVEGRFDLVFADPPYAHAYPRAVFDTLRSRNAIDARTTVVYEHSSRESAPADPGMRLARSERYGEVALEFLQPRASAA